MFIASLICLLISLLWLIFAPSKLKLSSDDHEIVNLKKGAVLPFLFALMFFIFSIFFMVPTRNVGVPTVFGKTTGKTYTAGLHMKAPWVKVTDIDGTIQPEEYNGDSAIDVKIADGGAARVSAGYRWRIAAESADDAFADFRKSDTDINDAVRAAVVSTNMKAAINEVFGTYDPLDGAELRPDMSPEELASAKINVIPDYARFNAAIKKNVEAKIEDLGGLVEIQSVTVSYLDLPEATQERINQFNAAVQDTKIALQQVATKNAQAEGNLKLTSSLKDPNVLVSKCLDSLAAGDFSAPAGFSCWPGGGSSVVIPGKK